MIRFKNFLDCNVGLSIGEITLQSYNSKWIQLYDEESATILDTLKIETLRLFHIGSTSIIGMDAKPIIDILGTVPNFDVLDCVIHKLITIGYELKGEFGIPNRRYCVLSDPISGKKFVHLHIFLDGSHESVRHLAFRNFLRSSSEAHNLYLKTKKDIINSDKIKNYQNEKNNVIKSLEAEALRYENLKKSDS